MPKATEIPLYELKINENEDSFVSAIALVENPAIEENFLAFSKQIQFALNDDQQILYGAAMIPNQIIFRRDEEGQEFNVFFSADTIKQIESVYFKKGFQNNINIEHTNTTADSYIFESFLVDKENGIAPKQFSDLPDGSWIIKAKVEDPAIWKEIKEGKRKGFSVEGIFQMIESNKNHFNINKEDEELLSLVKEINQMLEGINF